MGKTKNQKKDKAKSKNWFRRMGEMFAKGDIWTKLSFLISGLGNIVRGQVLKGLMFLSMELGFIFYMILSGINFISQIGELGSVEQKTVFNEFTLAMDVIPGENSMLILLYGLISICLIIAYVFVWQAGVKAAYEAQQLKESGKHLPTAMEDIKDHFDKKLHRTMMFLPTIGIMVFTILPLIFMVLIAFTNFDTDHQPPGHLFDWVGLTNFKTLFTAGSTLGKTFWAILTWTLIWAIFATFLNYIGGMLLAMIINRNGTRCKKLWRTIFIMSIAIPQFVSLLIMKTMLQQNGIINATLLSHGIISEALPFFTDVTWARVTVIIVNLWVGVPHTMLITTGILQNIPSDLYESAKVDGANSVVMFFKITLPYMLFVTGPYLITQFIGNINNFNVIYLLTGGAPTTFEYYQNAGKTDLLVTWLYRLTVDRFDYCYASVIGIAVFVVCATFSLLTYHRTGAYNNEEGFQ